MTRKHAGKLHRCRECGWEGEPYSHGLFPGEHPGCNYLAYPVHEPTPNVSETSCRDCGGKLLDPQHTDAHWGPYHRFVALLPPERDFK